MKTKETGITKIEGKKGPIYRVQIRGKGLKDQSRSFSNFTDAKRWKYNTINAQSSGEITETATMRRTKLSELIDRYIESDLDPSSTNYKTKLGHLRWWREELGHCIITRLTEDLISQALEKLQKTPDRYGKPRKNATINRYSTTLSSLLEKASKEWRLIPRNPVRSLKNKKEKKQKKKVLNFEECKKLLTVCKEHPIPYALPLLSLLLCTGFRKSEAINLRRKHFSESKNEIFLENTKNGESRIVPIIEPALSHLKEYLDSRPGSGEDLIFPGRNKEKPIDFRATWKSLFKKAGIEDFSTHCTRYTAVSLLSEQKVPLHIIAQIVGHKTLSMTMHYTNTSNEFVRTSLRNLGDKMS